MGECPDRLPAPLRGELFDDFATLGGQVVLFRDKSDEL
jgi:hypothetical protein